MICQQVPLSGDAEWPKVAGPVIEATQDILIPFLRPLPMRDLHIDMLYHGDLRHAYSLPVCLFPLGGIYPAWPLLYYNRPVNA